MEKRKAEEQAIRKQLATDNPKDYKQKAVNRINKAMEKWGINQNDLENIEPEKLIRIEEATIKQIYQKGNEKKLKEIINRANQNSESNNDKEAKEKVKAELKKFVNSTNIYEKDAYKKQKSKVDKLLNKLAKDLENHSIQTNPTQPKSIPWNYIIPFSLLGTLIISGLVVVKVRKKENTKKSK